MEVRIVRCFLYFEVGFNFYFGFNFKDLFILDMNVLDFVIGVEFI